MSNDLSTEPHSGSRHSRVATLVVMLLLVLYWCLIFYGTHANIPAGAIPGDQDKLMHCGAYAGLGFLLLALRATRGPFSWYSVIARWFVLAGYGAFDELTQMLVGRDAEFYDWYADLIGAALGLSLVTFILWLFSGRHKTQEFN